MGDIIQWQKYRGNNPKESSSKGSNLKRRMALCH
jgi:hypothetical protein